MGIARGQARDAGRCASQDSPFHPGFRAHRAASELPLLFLRRSNGAAEVHAVPVEHLVGQGHGPRHHLGLAHALLCRQVQRHPAHGALGQHPHRPKRVPCGGGFSGFVGVGQYLAQRFVQHLLQISQLRLQGFYTLLQLR